METPLNWVWLTGVATNPGDTPSSSPFLAQCCSGQVWHLLPHKISCASPSPERHNHLSFAVDSTAVAADVIVVGEVGMVAGVSPKA